MIEELKRLSLPAILAVALVMAINILTQNPAAADETIASGSFTGASGHVTSGGVSVQKTADGVVVVLGEDFSFDGAPDPKLGFGKDGYVKATQFSHLEANSGRQVYKIPASIDPAQYNEVWVWCERYAVPLGVARLQ